MARRDEGQGTMLKNRQQPIYIHTRTAWEPHLLQVAPQPCLRCIASYVLLSLENCVKAKVVHKILSSMLKFMILFVVNFGEQNSVLQTRLGFPRVTLHVSV